MFVLFWEAPHDVEMVALFSSRPHDRQSCNGARGIGEKPLVLKGSRPCGGVRARMPIGQFSFQHGIW